MRRHKLRAPRNKGAQSIPIIHDRKAIGLQGQADICVKIVSDPMEFGGKIEVVSRMDTLDRLRVGDPLIDEAHYQAGRQYQMYYEIAEVGRIRAMDTTYEPVDCSGRIPEFLTEDRQHAIRTLNRLDGRLGDEGRHLVRDVLIERMSIEKAALVRGRVSERGIRYTGGQFRECLNTLAKALCLA